MAHLHRLILLLLLVLVGSAQAAFPPTTSTQYRVTTTQVTGAWSASGTAACQDWIAKAISFDGNARSFVSASNTNCAWTGPAWSGATLNLAVNSGAVQSCSANATLSGGQCSCNSGFEQQANACVVKMSDEEKYCSDTAGSPVKTSFTATTGTLQSRPVCTTGGIYSCMSNIDVEFCGSGDGGSTYLCHGTGKSTSSTCTPSSSPQQPSAPNTPPTDWPNPPPSGTCPGTVNGMSVNVPCSNTKTETKKTETSSDSAGNVTSKAETKNTTCNAAGSCTTTVTTTTTVNGGNSTTSTKTTTEGKGEFCASNPGSKECGDGEGSSFGGSCEAGFQCEGDALQCAMAKEQHKRACTLFEGKSDERTAYEQAKLKSQSGVDQTADLPGNQTINIGAADFDASDAIGGAQCITDRTVEVAGRAVTIPLSDVCPYLTYIGQLLVVVGYLLGARILTRG